MEILENNSLVAGFVWVGMILLIAKLLSTYLFQNKLPVVATAIFLALSLAYFGKDKGLASFPLFGGLLFFGGAMLRDFTITATAIGADVSILKKTGFNGLLSLFVGITISFLSGAILAFFWGFTEAKDICTIAAGACTYIVGPVTGGALGASSEVMAISVAAGLSKTIFTTILTPLFAKKIGLVTPEAAILFGGLIGTSSGVAAGLAATNEELVPYGAITATFYTGLGCLLCPSLGFVLLQGILGYF